MQDEIKTERRNFLATALTAASSSLTIGLGQADAEGQEVAAKPHHATKSSLSFENLYDTFRAGHSLERRGG
jgi:hypothetical protein